MSVYKLAKPVQILESYRPIVLAFLKGYVKAETDRLNEHFGIDLAARDVPASAEEYLRLPIAEDCEQIALAAAGDTRSLFRSVVRARIRALLEKLFLFPGQEDYEIPHAFWLSDFGNMVLLAMVWSMNDKLITVSEAVAITGRRHDFFTHAAQRGKLTTYPDKNEPNPTKRTRLLKSEVMSLLQQ